ncbi:MAG: hypothetical protein HY778_00470, partial [Betaproteobacteria bacterium]|nr:hypothetical protein [Betaproteobacteria bacterium]
GGFTTDYTYWSPSTPTLPTTGGGSNSDTPTYTTPSYNPYFSSGYIS